QGAEHVKKMLGGGILSGTADELAKFIVLYSVIGAIHWLLRRPLLAAADHMDTSSGIGKIAFWDLVFYLSFGVVFTSSVPTAGVLLCHRSGAGRRLVLLAHRRRAGDRLDRRHGCERGGDIRVLPA